MAMVSRPSDPLEVFRAALAAAGGESLVLGADLGDEARWTDVLSTIHAWGGTADVLVYNASAGTQGPAAELEPAHLWQDFQVNVAAPLNAVRWVLPAMARAGRGTLLFTGGGLALHPKPGLAAGSLGKAALRSLALSLGQELAPQGIHAATITVCGFVQPDTALSPDTVAEAFWACHRQAREAWTWEITVP